MSRKRPIKTRLNKAEKHRIARIRHNASIIEALVPLELQRMSTERKHRLETAWSSLATHMYELTLEPPKLGVYYAPQQYLEHARWCVNAVKVLEDQFNTVDKA